MTTEMVITDEQLAEMAADACGVTRYSDMRPFVIQATLYALKRRNPLPTSVTDEHVERACKVHNVGWSKWHEPQKKTAREVMRSALSAASLPPIRDDARVGAFDHRGTLARVVAILNEFGMPPEGEVDQFEWLRERLSAIEPAQQQVYRAGPYGWLIVDPALDEEARQLSASPADENEVKDGCQSFALYLTDEDETRLRALASSPQGKGEDK